MTGKKYGVAVGCTPTQICAGISSLNRPTSYKNEVTNNQSVAGMAGGEMFHEREFGKSTEGMFMEQ